MQRKTKLWMAGGAAALLTLGGIGLANADMNGPMMGRGGWGMGMMGHGGHMMMQQLMERYDLNKDGKITQDEINQNRADWLKEFDTDKNGTLSLDEFKNLWLKARYEEMVREFQFFDRDGNGQVTLDEYQKPLADLVANRDRNGDGSLGRDDRPQRGERWRHGDGEGRRGMMGQGMGHGQGMMGNGQGMMGDGQGMMNDGDGNDEGGSDGNAPPPQPEAPSNP